MTWNDRWGHSSTVLVQLQGMLTPSGEGHKFTVSASIALYVLQYDSLHGVAKL